MVAADLFPTACRRLLHEQVTSGPPKEFRDDVVAVARKGEAPVAEIARDLGISEFLSAKLAGRGAVENGVRPGDHRGVSELRELKRRSRPLAQENEVLRRAEAFGSDEFGASSPASQ